MFVSGQTFSDSAGKFAGQVVSLYTENPGARSEPLIMLAAITVMFSTTLSFLTAPALAWLNHRAITGPEVPAEHRPGRRMVVFSWISIVFWAPFEAYFLMWKVKLV